MITPRIRSFLDAHRLGYVATASPDGHPNVSPKGTIIGWDETTLAFADIRSPDTVRNIESNPRAEISAIDPVSRRGYLFEGTCSVLREGPEFDELVSHYRQRGVKSPIGAVVLVAVSRVSEVRSLLYDMGLSEDKIRSRWKGRYGQL